jgi:methylenetetrahydrofolate reductase (NADPH)
MTPRNGTGAQPGSTLRQAIESGQFAITAEIVPPASADPEQLLARARPLKGLVSAVNVTDAAGARAAMGALPAAVILHNDGIDPILQMTCRDRNRIAIQGDLIGAAALGIRNILALAGDDPKTGDQPDAKPVGDLNSTALIATAAALRDKGELPSARKVEGDMSFYLGAADAPIDPPADWEPKGLRAKIEAGAQFAQTQFCMDIGVVRRYAARLAQEGITDKLKFLIGVTPFASAKSAIWMKEKLFGTIIPDAFIKRMESAADPKAEGQAICTEFLLELAEVKGIAGAHIMAPLNSSSIPAVIEAFRKGRG